MKEFRNIEADEITQSCEFEAASKIDVKAVLNKLAKENDKLEGWSFLED